MLPTANHLERSTNITMLSVVNGWIINFICIDRSFGVKILFVASVYRHFTSFHIPYLKYLKGRGYSVYVAAARDDVRKKELLALGFNCIDIPFSRSPLAKGNIEAYNTLKSLFRKESFSLVHVHTPVAAMLTRLAFRHSSFGKVLYTAHGFHFFKGAPLLNWLIYYPIERISSKWTDVLITINSEDYKRALTMGFKDNTVQYVHGVGVETVEILSSEEERNILKRQLGLDHDAVVISYIAEINQNKNHSFLLKNWRHIKEQSPKAVLLLIGDGNLKNDLEKFILQEKLEDIHILGFRKDVAKLLEITDIVSLLSYREGLPKSIMEAMASRIPCVVSDTRGLRDLITHGENGFVVSQGDNEELVNSFVSLLNNESVRKKMAINAFRDVEPYRLENVLREYMDIYDRVLRNG